MNKLILASKSPRRKELLEQLGLDFKIITSDIEEVFDKTLPLTSQVMNIAYSKAKVVAKNYKDDFVIGADTIVFDNKNEVFGKAKDREHAKSMLLHLSGKAHQVITGVAILYKEIKKEFFISTDVHFYELSLKEIDDYLNTNEWIDKAGAYAIQGIGSRFVESVNGDYYSVIGLPISKLIRLLEELGFEK